MQLPLVAPAPLVVTHAKVFQDLFENRCQFQHFQNYSTGLMVLENKSLTNMARCILASADKTNLSRFFSEAAWLRTQVNERRLRYLRQQTRPFRQRKELAALIFDDTLCEHVGSLFEYVDRHYNHGEDTYPLAHNPVTSHYVSGPVRFPVELRLYRRYDELTRWEEFIHQHFPDQEIPKTKKKRTQLHKEVAPVLLQDPEFRALHEQFRTKIDLAIDLLESAIRHKLPFGMLLFDGWYLSEALVQAAKRRKKDWISILKKNRNLETNSFVLRDANHAAVKFTEPHIAVEDLVRLLPASAYRAVQLDEKTYWTFTFTARIPSLGKVRLVISFENAELTGSYAVLVTNRLDWSAHRIIATYLLRWPIETFYQDGKSQLGLDEYRMRSAEAIEKHWCLVFVAYSFLHLDCLPPSPVKRPALLKSIGEACRQQAEALIRAWVLFTHERLQPGQSAKDVFDFLRDAAKQRGGVAT